MAAVMAILCAWFVLQGFGKATAGQKEAANAVVCESATKDNALECTPQYLVVGDRFITADTFEISSPAEPEEEPAPVAGRSRQDFSLNLRLASSAQQALLPSRHLYSGRAPPGNA